jgi:hypothetical protein
MLRALLVLRLLITCLSFGEEPVKRNVIKLTAKRGEQLVAEVTVDTNDAPDLAEWGVKAGKLCVDWLPKIAALLSDDKFEPPKSVTLLFDPNLQGVAHTGNGRITIAAGWVRAHPGDWGMVIHELTHVVQDYKGGGEGWLTEGIADYIRHRHFEKNAESLAKRIDPAKSSYKQAYTTAAAFLVWLEEKRNKDIVSNLNAASRAGTYNAELFTQYCGSAVDVLWKEFMAEAGAAQKP